MEQKLSVFDIQRFSIHDGTGIRTTVFLQGCPLRCRWCANPESQACRPQLLHIKKKCIGCRKCYEACCFGAISFKEGYPQFDRELCTRCGECVKVCPTDAIKMSSNLMTVDEVLEIVMKDKEYYDDSNGGITISGGEAFMQFQGLLSLLKKSKGIGINTTIETCGQYQVELIQEALPYVDTFLFDLKHVNEDALYEFTRGNANLIINNIKYIQQHAKDKLQVRIPVIPGFNADAESMASIYETLIGLGINEVELLPYHTLGISKYEQLGQKYQLESRTSLLKKELTPYADLGISYGLSVRV